MCIWPEFSHDTLQLANTSVHNYVYSFIKYTSTLPNQKKILFITKYRQVWIFL